MKNFSSENPGIPAGSEDTRCKSTNVERLGKSGGRDVETIGGIEDITTIFAKWRIYFESCIFYY